MHDEGGEDVQTGSPIDPAAIERLLDWGGPALQAKMIDLFFENGPERMEGVKAGLAGGDIGSAERAAHSLKSSAGNLGAGPLQEVARTVEKLLEEGNVAEAEARVPEMETALERSLEALREIRERV